MALRLYTSVPKGLTLKVRKFWRLGSTFVEVTGKSLSRVIFGSFSPSSWIGINNTPVSNQVETNEQVSRTWFKKLEKEKLIFTKLSINAAIEKNDFSVPNADSKAKNSVDAIPAQSLAADSSILHHWNKSKNKKQFKQ